MTAFGAVPWWCPNGCGRMPGHLSPELVTELVRIAVPPEFPLGTGYCKGCKQIVQGKWKDLRLSNEKRAA